MTEGRKQVKDPVCQMMVDPTRYTMVHDQYRYAFCSKQCQDRFLAHPHVNLLRSFLIRA